MSDVSALVHGKLSLPDFIVKVAGELASNPFTKLFAPVLLKLLQAELINLTKSPTAAALIVQDIQNVIDGKPSGVEAQLEAGLLAALVGWESGQSGSQTGADVLAAASAAS